MEINRQTYCYTTGWVALAAAIGATGQATFTIPTDEDFECKYLMGVVTQAGVIVLNWAGTIQITTAGTLNTMFFAPVPFDSICGNARNPFPLDPPRLFKGRSTTVFDFVNPVATATSVSVTLYGNKLLTD